MAVGRVLKAASVFAVVGVCVAAPMAHAAQVEDPGDADDQTQQLSEDIGCVATYDALLAAGRGKIKAVESVRHARDAALNAFRQDSDLSEAQVREAVAQAYEALPEMLKQAHVSLGAYKAACDAAFMANPFADSDAQPL